MQRLYSFIYVIFLFLFHPLLYLPSSPRFNQQWPLGGRFSPSLPSPFFFFASSSAREPTCHPWVKDCAAIMESSAGPAYDSNPAAVLASHNRTPRGELAQGLCYAELPDCGGISDEESGGSEFGDSGASTDSAYLPDQTSTFVVGANSTGMLLAAEAMCRLSRCNPETGLWQVWQGAATCTRPALTQNQSFSSLSPPLAQVFEEPSSAAGDEGAPLLRTAEVWARRH